MGSRNRSGYQLSLPAKAVAVSAAVLSAAVMLRLSGPSVARFASSEIPRIYASFISWLTPPYLYFVVNGIIISIAASCRFQTGDSSGSDDVHVGSGSGSNKQPQDELVVVNAPAPVVVEEEVKLVPPAVEVDEQELKLGYDAPASDHDVPAEEEEEDDFVISRSSWTPPKSNRTRETVLTKEESNIDTAPTEIPTEYLLLLNEKPLVSARLGRRKSLKSSPHEAGKALGVSRPKRYDTLESTWKAITDGRAVPLTRHLKKSDTWETRAPPDEAPAPAPAPVMRKSETFNEVRRPPAPRLRREPSPGQDDLNRRVEAFINKFNEEMRLQRQQSFKHYMDMINRGTH